MWKLPYAYTLKHTVEEILYHCKLAATSGPRLKALIEPVRARLGLPSDQNVYALPEQMTLDQFCKTAKQENAFVFLGLHGGIGEDGTIQAILDEHKLPYNGPGARSSAICADKNKTGERIAALNDPMLIAAPKICFTLKEASDDITWLDTLWKRATTTLQSSDLLIKPQNDGCSTGVVRLFCAEDLGKFLAALRRGDKLLLPGTLNNQTDTIELSADPDQLMIEPFIVSDDIHIADKSLNHRVRTNWIELTVGVLESEGTYHALTPSITVAESHVLSLEEKFQGGTGINLTPPPASIMTPEQIRIVRDKIELAAKTLGIEGYSRLDIFFNTKSNVTLLIEANTLPGLTAATVIFHQAFAENPPLSPSTFLALLVEDGLSRFNPAKAA